jgi:hypothetical protein
MSISIGTILLIVLILVLLGLLPTWQHARSRFYVLSVAPGHPAPLAQLWLICWVLAGAAVVALVIANAVLG